MKRGPERNPNRRVDGRRYSTHRSHVHFDVKCPLGCGRWIDRTKVTQHQYHCPNYPNP